ncbi:MAG: hypothetical protein U9R75_06405, partial [Candidatus Thermoplasmatota archaeon]|nr:hypothetical protein [Candidatus Thermoplasmatota archaeon]
MTDIYSTSIDYDPTLEKSNAHLKCR